MVFRGRGLPSLPALLLGALLSGLAASCAFGADVPAESLDTLRAVESKVIATAEAAGPAVVRVNRSAGVLVSADGVVLTAAHLGGLGGEQATVRLADGRSLKATVLGRCGTADAAMLKIASGGPFPHVPLGSTADLQPGDRCLVFGHMHPLIAGRPAVLRVGRITKVTADRLTTDCTSTGGDSGGPVLDTDGRLIGINSFGFPGRLWHVPIDVFKTHWDRLAAGERWGGRPRLRFTGAQLMRMKPTRPQRGEAAVGPVATAAARSVVTVLCDGRAACLGTVVTADGLVVTKASELKGTVTCQLPDGRTAPAERLGVRDAHDLALLRVQARPLVPVTWAEAEDRRVGRWVVTPGPDGRVRGVGVVGVACLTVPRFLSELGAGFDPAPGGPATVTCVQPYRPAAEAGIRAGDRVVSVQGKPTPTLDDVRQRLKDATAGGVRVGIARGGQRLELAVMPAGAQRSGPVRIGTGDVPGGVMIVQPRRRRVADGRADGFPVAFQHDTPLEAADGGAPVVGLDGKALGVNVGVPAGPACYALPAELVIKEMAGMSGAGAPDGNE